MKKRILIFCTALIALSLIAMTSINRNGTNTNKIDTVSLATCSNSDSIYVANYVTVKSNYVEFDDIVYDVDSRFMTTITRDRLIDATSVP